MKTRGFSSPATGGESNAKTGKAESTEGKNRKVKGGGHHEGKIRREGERRLKALGVKTHLTQEKEEKWGKRGETAFPRKGG